MYLEGVWAFIILSIIPGEAKNLPYCVCVHLVFTARTVPCAVLPIKTVPYDDPPLIFIFPSSHLVLHVSASGRVGIRVYTESYFLHDCFCQIDIIIE